MAPQKRTFWHIQYYRIPHLNCKHQPYTNNRNFTVLIYIMPWFHLAAEVSMRQKNQSVMQQTTW